MPLVLVHNDVVMNPAHQWNDVEGVHYHYPSKYRAKIKTGEPFVYYRGVNRAGNKRGPAEYFGQGSIGKIWPDPERKNAWYCAIENYERFPSPVAAKIDGAPREIIASNLWRDGVRVLDPQVYQAIIAVGNAANDDYKRQQSAPSQAELAQPGELILPTALGKHQNVSGEYERSRRSKEIGDWAEVVALAYIQSEIVGCADCTHRAALGETPGWDIDYRDAQGVLQRVEVKGTVAAAFSAIDLTKNEMTAAVQHEENYWICLIAKCETQGPRIQLLRNPAKYIGEGAWRAKPTVYRVSFSSAQEY